MTMPVYMDHNASVPLLPAAQAAMLEALAMAGNAASVHSFGRVQRAHVDKARAAIASLVGALAEGVVFTSGGTEANNLAIGSRGDRRLVVSAIEHLSVLATARASGAAELAVDRDGRIDLDALSAELARDPRPAFVSLMLANNETGVVQPIAEAAAICRRHGALLHCDAVQALGRMTVNIKELGADYLTISGHKIGGPQGVGALVAAPGRNVSAQILGGGQERGRRAGTQSVAAISGFGVAAASVDFALAKGLEVLRNRLEAGLEGLGEQVRVFGRNAPRLANTTCFAVAGKRAETLVMGLDLAGYAVSAGSACSSGKIGPSHVVLAMTGDEELARSAIRVSLGVGNNQEQIDGILQVLRALAQGGRRKDAA